MIAPSTEPVLFAALARILVLCGLHFGLKIDAASIVGLMGAMELVLSPLLRSKVTPVTPESKRSA